jgi:hypothetical protein
MPAVDKALHRLREFACPLEDARVQRAQRHGGVIGKVLIYKYENPINRPELVLIKDALGC